MGYLELLNGFYEFLQADRLTPNAQLLYYTLLQIDNKCGWAPWFKRTNVSLCGLMGVGEKALMTARNELKQRGLIDFITSKKRGDSTRYSVLCHSKAGTKAEEGQEKRRRNEGEPSPINRQRQTKRQERNSPLPFPQGVEEIVKGYTQNPQLQETIEEFIDLRKSLNKPFTKRGLELTLAQLDQMYPEDGDKIRCLNQSIMNSWQGIFALPKASEEAKPRHDYSQRHYQPGELAALVEDVSEPIEM